MLLNGADQCSSPNPSPKLVLTGNTFSYTWETSNLTHVNCSELRVGNEGLHDFPKKMDNISAMRTKMICTCHLILRAFFIKNLISLLWIHRRIIVHISSLHASHLPSAIGSTTILYCFIDELTKTQKGC